jgi:hypothetical protein
MVGVGSRIIQSVDRKIIRVEGMGRRKIPTVHRKIILMVGVGRMIIQRLRIGR